MPLSLQSKRELEHQIEEINAGRPQCPVGLNTLVLPSKNTISESERTPYVYLKCGHVHGQHSWGKRPDTNSNICPLCREVCLSVCLSVSLCVSLCTSTSSVSFSR